MNRDRVKLDFVGRARHPFIPRQELGQVPCHHDGAEGATDEAFPRFVGTERQKWTVNEFAPPCHSTNVGHNVVGEDQTARKDVPKETVENIVHNILELTHDQAQDDDRPTKLIDLKADITPLQCCDGDAEGRCVQSKGCRG